MNRRLAGDVDQMMGKGLMTNGRYAVNSAELSISRSAGHACCPAIDQQKRFDTLIFRRSMMKRLVLVLGVVTLVMGWALPSANAWIITSEVNQAAGVDQGF